MLRRRSGTRLFSLRWELRQIEEASATGVQSVEKPKVVEVGVQV